MKMKQSINYALRNTLYALPGNPVCLRWIKRLAFSALLLISSVFAQTGAKYLAIAHDNFVNAVKPLIEWKTKKGVPAVCVPLSVTGSTPTQIKSYIQNAYDTWNPRPEFILLVGSPDLLPAYSSGYNYYDGYYADMTGDYEMELSIGRFHCATLVQCSLMVAKTIGYEKSETMHDSAWFSKGTTIVGEDNPPDPYYQADTRYIRNFWQRTAFYTQIDSFISTQGNNATDVINAINDGRAFVVYRGQSVSYWWGQFDVDPDLTNNGYKLPIVVSGTCATMTLTPGEQMLGDDFLRAGTVQNPKGAVGFFGTAFVSSHISLYRGTVTKGFFQALYQDRIYTMGGAAKRGKFILDSLYHIQDRYLEWNLLGDPELNVWTSKPKLLTVTHDTIIYLQPADFPVSVYSNTTPVQNALVCVMMDSTVYNTGYTDINGQLTLSLTPQHIGTLQVTVTGHNYFPYEGTAQVMAGNIPYVQYHHCLIDDHSPGGNGDSLINPGETVNLSVYLINSGTQPAYNVSAQLSTTDQQIRILDSIANFGDISPQGISSAANPYRFTVASSCANGHVINFNLHVTDDSSHIWDSPFSVFVDAAELFYNNCQVTDSSPGGNNNGQLGPAENVRLRLTINNSGLGGLTDVYTRLRTNSPYIAITDSFGYIGTINPSASGNNNFDPFAVSLSPSLPRNYPIQFTVYVHGNGGTYSYLNTFTFTLYSEQGQTSDPTGPDGYGYYCYDNTDISFGRAPTYDWFEIAPPGPGTIIDQISNSDANLDTLTIPFTFKYYGQNYYELTAAINGFLAMGRTNYRWGYNSPIPDTSGPSAMIAPFWDDLNANDTLHGGNGEVYQYFDTTNHRWIFEFKDVAHYERNSVRETFQTILLDPTYYPTPTNDGEIIFQYQTVGDATGNTVGIENYPETDGIQYVFNNNYAMTAAPLNTERAIRFTTWSPNTTSPWLTLTSLSINDSIGGNNNRIPEPGENIQLEVTLTNRGGGQAENVTAQLRNTDGDATVTDSLADFGIIAVQGQANNSGHPYSFTVSLTPSDTILDFSLVISATSYNTIQYLALGLNGSPGVSEAFRGTVSGSLKLECFPNPFSKLVQIKLQVPEALSSTAFRQSGRLKIYDAIGQLVLSHRIPVTNNFFAWDGTDRNGKLVPKGLYFLVLTNEKNKIIINKKVIRTD
jgi:hypothetical protein